MSERINNGNGFFRNFQSFEPTQGVDPNAGGYANAPYAGSFYDPTAYAAPDPAAYDGDDCENEPPLLEGKPSNSTSNGRIELITKVIFSLSIP